ncbi:MAG TPA: chitobiase/beta-hexosaminidase C-terminal domain-containing protein, partial [Planctomycetota bacterium]|nr:chitobiase/beta-hexosaminidase C-terminal domain-containing protein [Planctomycetota bacterium]
YDAGRGYGYERIDPGNNSRGGYAVFGPFDDSPNPRSQFPDRCPDEIYDSFIGAKDFSSPCVGALNPPCLPLEGIVFRVDVPNGAYRFVAAVGSADNPHAHRIVVEDGGAGPPSNLGANHVVLVDNYDQGVHGAGVFARVGFDSYFPPEIPGAGFVDMDELGLETAGPPESPILEVTQGYLRVHQLKGVSNGADPNGGDLVVLELWRVDGGGSEHFRAIERGERWEYRPGTSEPPSDWIEPSFDSSSWSEGNAPFGFGEAGVATDLSLGNPPMQGNFTSVYLRKTFELSDPTLVGELVARVRYDDGFVLYGNGLELLRVNAPGVEGSPLPATATAIGGHEADAFETFELPNPIDWLRAGENTIAVQILNSAIGSTDLFFDAEIYDPFGPDLTAPSIATITPLPGATLRRLEEVRVSFDEDVQGVDAADLLINGSPATSVSGDGAGPWVFTFPSPAPGVVEIDWSASAGITDLANPPNAFSGEPWTYTLDPDAPAAEVVIHEILAVKNGGPRDEDGEESDYIELLNRGDAPVDLGGWSLTQSPDEPGEWVFPSVLIAPGEHLVVYASGKDRRTPGSPLHTSFKLSAGGEYLGLYDADAPPRLVSELAPRFPPQRAGVSYGTDANGKQVWFATPTPGAPNSTGTTFSGFVLEPVAKPGRGFYEEPVLVTLSSATPDATIRYTLDGSEPTPTSGLVYSGPFEASGAPQRGVVTVRAMASKAGSLPSEVVTFTYVFPEHVMTQPPNPPGFPTSWNGQPADYAMDPRIVNDPGHREL